jgi:hypothetical protein
MLLLSNTEHSRRTKRRRNRRLAREVRMDSQKIAGEGCLTVNSVADQYIGQTGDAL